MTDREMLELAAKAVGLTGECYLLTGDCSDPAEPGGFRYEHPDGGHDWWNPLTDDGDALRLAVKMGIYVHCRAGSMVTSAIGDGDEWVIENWSNDPTSATRRAITRAAAQIGKGMK